MEFQPQQVESKSWRYWFKEALSLSTRNILLFALLALLVSGTHYLPELLRGFTLLGIPLFLSFGVVLAESADKSNTFFSAASKTPRIVWVRLFIAGSIPWIMASVFGVVLMMISRLIGAHGNPSDFDIAQTQTLSVAYEAGMAMLAVMLFWFITIGYFLWFVVPLIVIAELPIIESYEQSFEALSLNGWFVKVILAFSFAALLFALFLPILFIPWYAMASSMMYVSFRHIWMGKRDNNPVPVSSGIPVAVSK